MKTIEPAIQEAILDILPDNGNTAIELMCQLIANMILSIDNIDINLVTKLIKVNLDEYQGT